MANKQKAKSQKSALGVGADALGITFRQFALSAYCAHGKHIGNSWKRALDQDEPNAAPLMPVERVLGLLRGWVTSESYSEPDSPADIVGALVCNYGSRGMQYQEITAEEVKIIEDIWEEHDHALELIAPDVWEARHQRLAVETTLTSPLRRSS